ncbi:hypothetical protein BRE01_62800 [Brevibacillus reuszeri]|uniref:Uncharacterized protein n=1 Tax=Brevibacillus reuszeri TaxID=54915 RepID=A0A0K9YWB2_9BACL|nr:hypothetical protein [Brevibacillus reuszeri]KNB72961.1 hypothetical protein ADS79_14160 [Brevibacillus reuszeri]GED72578.1 hypothetical protein BRE01_62800 [Brevibacillus reuszeri]
MNFSITEILGVLGFILALINLGISLYKDFYRKPTLHYKLKNYAKSEKNGDFSFQVSIRLIAKHGDVYLTGAKVKNQGLVNKNVFALTTDKITAKAFNDGKVDIKTAVNFMNEDMSLNTINDIFVNAETAKGIEKIEVDDLLIKNQSALTLNFYFSTYNRDKASIPLEDWKFVITTDYQEIQIDLP